MTPWHSLMSLTPTSPKMEENIPEDRHSNTLFRALQTTSTAWDSVLEVQTHDTYPVSLPLEWEGRLLRVNFCVSCPATFLFLLIQKVLMQWKIYPVYYIWRQTLPTQTKRQIYVLGWVTIWRWGWMWDQGKSIQFLTMTFLLLRKMIIFSPLSLFSW